MKRENDRDTAEALALLELIEAQEAAPRNHRPTKEDYYKYLVSSSRNPPDEEMWMNARVEPSARYFGLAPRSYEMNNYGLSKRFMVAKKRKRSIYGDGSRAMARNGLKGYGFKKHH